MRSVVIAGLWVIAGCGGATSSPRGAESAVERAYVTDGEALLEVDATTGAARALAAGVTWCAADARADAVWYVTGAGLAVFDLASRRSTLIVKGAFAIPDQLDAVAPIVDWGDQRLGGERSFVAGLRLAMTARPTATVVIGCEGDRAIRCFADDGKTPRPVVAEHRRAAEALSLVAPDKVAALASRGAHRSLWSPAPQDPPRPTAPAVPDRCYLTGTCGALAPVAGSPLWLVETADDRGDATTQVRELWDPTTREFVRLSRGGLQRSREVPAPEAGVAVSYAGLRSSPAGRMSFDGYVFDARRVIFAPTHDRAMSCGWSNGGWRTSGFGELPL